MRVTNSVEGVCVGCIGAALAPQMHGKHQGYLRTAAIADVEGGRVESACACEAVRLLHCQYWRHCLHDAAHQLQCQ